MESLAKEISIQCRNSSLEFQQFLSDPKIFQSQHITRIFSNLISSDQQMFTTDQRNLVAVSLKYVFLKRCQAAENLSFHPTSTSEIEPEVIRIRECWQQYLEEFLNNDQITWKYLQLTSNAMNFLIDQLDGAFLETFVQKFPSIRFLGQLAIYSTLQDSEYNVHWSVFVRETLTIFLENSYQFVLDVYNQVHTQSDQKDLLIVHRDLIELIYDILSRLNEHKDISEDCFDIFDKVSKSSLMINLLTQILIFSPSKSQTPVLSEMTKFEFSEIVLVQEKCPNFSQQNLDMVCQIKSWSMACIQLLLQSYPESSSHEDFEYFHLLSLLKGMIPMVLEKLIIFKQINNRELKESQTALMLLGLLNRGCQFAEISQFFCSHEKQFIYEVFPYFTEFTKEEQHMYEDDDAQSFIASQDSYFEINSDNGTPETVREQAAMLLQSFTKRVYGSWLRMAIVYSDALSQMVMNGQGLPEQGLMSINNPYSTTELFACNKKLTPSTLVSLMVRISYASDLESIDVNQVLYRRFIASSYIFQLKGIERSLFLHFLSYIYQKYFGNNLDEGSKYLLMSNDSKNQNKVFYSLHSELLRNSYGSGIDENIWNGIMDSTQHSSVLKDFEFVRILVKDKLESLPGTVMCYLINNLCSRIRNESQKSQFDSQLICEIYNILEEVSQNTQYLKEEPDARQSLIEVVRVAEQVMLKRFQTHGYNGKTDSNSDQVVRVFIGIIKAEEGLTAQHMQILPLLKQLVIEVQDMPNQVIEAFYLILLKGGSFFESEKQTQPYESRSLVAIQSQLELFLLDPKLQREPLVRKSCFLLQNIFLIYGHLVSQNSDHLFQGTQQYFNYLPPNERQYFLNNEPIQFLKEPSTKAALITLWMSMEYAFDSKINVLNIIQNNRIQTYRKEYGMMFLLNVQKLIQKYHCKQTKIAWELFKQAVLVLDYERFYKTRPQYLRNKDKIAEIQICIFQTHLKDLSSFEILGQCFEIIKSQLSSEKEYEQFISVIKDKDVGEESLRDLFETWVGQNQKVRKIVHVRRHPLQERQTSLTNSPESQTKEGEI